MKPKQFLKKLRELGVEIVPDRGKGGHVGLRYRGRMTTIAIHGDRDIPPFILKKTYKQLGIEPKDMGK